MVIHNLMTNIALIRSEDSDQTLTEQLAQRWQLPIVTADSQTYDVYLRMTPDGLALTSRVLNHIRPFILDFNSGALYHRLKQIGKKQPLARAVGIKPGTYPNVLDATAGLGRDGMTLACLGCQVTLIERSPIMAILLEDALMRATVTPNKPVLYFADSYAYLQNLSKAHYPDVIYYDPMFPHRSKSALVKKEMQLLQALLPEETHDEAQFLSIALQHAQTRVVVKRPQWASPINGFKPSFQINTPQLRFDVYLCSN